MQRHNGLFSGAIHAQNEWPDRPTATDRPTDEANSACPSDESTNHLQKHFYAIIPAARRGGRSSVDRQSLYYTETRIYAFIQGGTVCPVTLRKLMSHALHFLMTSVTPKYEF